MCTSDRKYIYRSLRPALRIMLICMVLACATPCFAAGYSLLPDTSQNTTPDDDVLIIRETAPDTVLPLGYTDSLMLYTLTYARGNYAGLKNLNASCSGQFSEQEFGFIELRAGNVPITIIDLRSDAHLFLNDYAVNCPRSEQAEESILAKDYLGLLLKLTPEKKFIMSTAYIGYAPERITLSQTEREYCLRHNTAYCRLSANGLAQQLAEFAAIVQRLPRGTWIHVHDKNGEVAPLFLCALDIIKNSTNVKIDDIILRNSWINRHSVSEDNVKVLKNFATGSKR